MGNTKDQGSEIKVTSSSPSETTQRSLQGKDLDPEVRVTADIETEDSLALRLKSLRVDGPKRDEQGVAIRQVLERQTRRILDDVNYLDGELALIEVDGNSHAVQIRTKKPAEGRFTEVILRKGNSIAVEGRGGAILVSRENYGRLVDTLKDLVG